MRGTSVTVVLIGDKTWQSEAVTYEVELSLKKGTPNGILGIRLHDGVKVPESLRECGAEIIEWKPNEFETAIDRAALAAGRAKVAEAGPGGGSRCIR